VVEPVETLTDADVPAWWQALGLPGLIDVHVHLLPPRVMEKVRHQFDSAGPLIGRPWPLQYRGDEDDLVARLRALGVRRFSALPYAHRPGIAEYLNEWAADLAVRAPEVLTSATLFPEPGVETYVARRIEAGVRVFKVHVQVGRFELTDPLLDEAWGLIEEAAVPTVIHVNSGPVANEHTGPEPMRALLRRHPRLVAVLAHMGAPEYADFLDIAERHETVRLDTTMAFTDFSEGLAPFPRRALPRLDDLGERILLGSDFPNIPYAYVHQLHALERLGLGDDWLRAVCYGNGARLFEL
jgi:hypothetical protein